MIDDRVVGLRPVPTANASPEQVEYDVVSTKPGHNCARYSRTTDHTKLHDDASRLTTARRRRSLP